MKRRKVIMIAVACFITGFISGMCITKGIDIPFVKRQDQWSIAIYAGESPLHVASPANVKNPVLTAKDVTDVKAVFVADPFMVHEQDIWFMFFEVLNKNSGHGDVGLATSDDGMRWTYKQIVLDEPFHLSYPCVFKWKNAYYMIPECQRETNAIRLYKSDNFPTQWSFVTTLLDNLSYYADPSVFRFDGKWWMFVQCPKPGFLSLYYARELAGPWIEHPESPVVLGDPRVSRPGGRVVVYDNRIIRYAQDGRPNYGSKVRAFEITELTTEKYKEKKVAESFILQASGSGWNAKGMHHIDPHQIAENKWIACVDGHKEILLFGFKY